MDNAVRVQQPSPDAPAGRVTRFDRGESASKDRTGNSAPIARSMSRHGKQVILATVLIAAAWDVFRRLVEIITLD